MTTEASAADRRNFKAATKRGVRAAVLLAILTLIEFLIASSLENPLLPLLPFVLAKGWIILDSFMHVRDLFNGGSGH